MANHLGSGMTRPVLVIITLSLAIGGLMAWREQVSPLVLRAAIAACGGLVMASAILILRRKKA